MVLVSTGRGVTSADARSFDQNERRRGSAAVDEARDRYTSARGQLRLVEVGEIPVNSAATGFLPDLVGENDGVLAGADRSGAGAEGKEPDESGSEVHLAAEGSGLLDCSGETNSDCETRIESRDFPLGRPVIL